MKTSGWNYLMRFLWEFINSKNIIFGILFLPLPSIQHFFWPVPACLMADFCNHTWIPECAIENSTGLKRVFSDECDLFEYSCDNAKEFEIIEYQECWKPTICPTSKCPSEPTCPDHRFHRMGDRYITLKSGRRRYVPPCATATTSPYTSKTPPPGLPPIMLRKDKRRYLQWRYGKNWWRKRTSTKNKVTTTTQPTTTIVTTTTTTTTTTEKPKDKSTVILKRETVIKNGIKVIKVVKGYAKEEKIPLKIFKEESSESSDFLEK